MTTDFFTENDKKVLEFHGVNIDEDIPIFLQELKTYFETIWEKKYIDELDITNLDTFNKSINYPNWEGYQILDDSFTGPCNIDCLSDKSISLLGYFYGINLRR
jgi:hypothetical protein